MLAPWKKSYDQHRQYIKKRVITLLAKVHLIKRVSSCLLWMRELNYKESRVPKNWCFWTVVLEKSLQSPLGCKEIKPVNTKGNQSWIFIGRTDAEAPILWPPDVKNWLLGKDPDIGKDWRREEKGTTEDEMVGCHHWLDGREFEQALGVGDGQGGMVCRSPWGYKELHTTGWLNWLTFQNSESFGLKGAQLNFYEKNPSFKDYRYVGFFANKTVPKFKLLTYIVLSVADNKTNCHYRSEKDELKIWVHKMETTIRASSNYKGRYVWAFLGKKQVARSYCHNFFHTAYFSRKRTVSWRPDMKYTSKRGQHCELPPGPSLFGTQRHFYTERGHG